MVMWMIYGRSVVLSEPKPFIIRGIYESKISEFTEA